MGYGSKGSGYWNSRAIVVAQKLLESKIFLAQELARGEDFSGPALKKLTEVHLRFRQAPP